MANDPDGVKKALARAVAGRQVEPKVVTTVGNRLAKLDYRIHGLSPCIYGICIDFFVDKPEIDPLIRTLSELGKIKELRLFPWGIPWPELFQVHIEQQFDDIPDAGLGH